jgi:hypothetical protein
MSTTISNLEENNNTQSVECTSMVPSPGKDYTALVQSYSPVFQSIWPSQSPKSLVKHPFFTTEVTGLIPSGQKQSSSFDMGLDLSLLKPQVCLLFLPVLPILLFDTPQKLLTFGSCLAGLVGFLNKKIWWIVSGLWVLILIVIRYWLR